MSELFEAVDALIAGRSPLPPPAERERLRKAHGLSQEEIATALKVRRATVVSWEKGRTEPRPPQREAYARLLDKLAELYPAESTEVEREQATAPAASRTQPETEASPSAPPAVPETFAGPSAPEPRSVSTGPALDATDMTADQDTSRCSASAVSRPAGTTRPTSTSRLLTAGGAAAKKTTSPVPAAVGPRFTNGPLAVIDAGPDGRVSAYCVGGLVLDVPARSLPTLVEWTLAEAKLGQPRLHRSGKDADPLLVLTAAAAEQYGLPVRLEGEELRRSMRLPDGHKVVKQLAKAGWQLTKRGFGPWVRIYRPAEGNRRYCVQLCLPSWDALDARHWGDAAALPPADLAHLLGVYATRVMTPRGSTAVTGLELMTALRPPTRAVPGENGTWTSGHNPGSLGTEPVEPAPPEVPDGHPLLADLPRFHQRGPAEMLLEEAYDWARPMTDEECLKPYVVGIDVNMAFAAAANGTVVGLGKPVHVKNPAFESKVPGSWLVDLSHAELDPRLPSPFTPDGQRPEGPAWYATPTVAYAVELGYDVAPIEAYLRPENSRYLDAWYTRLRDAYLATMADLGVTTHLGPQEFLAAMAGHRQADPQMAIVLSAIKATVKGGIGKLRERPRGGGWRPGQPWPALQRPTWRPDIRAAVIAKARINMHRKMLKLASATSLYPVAVLSDCVVYASGGPSPLDFLPHTPEGKSLPGTFRIGVSPGMVKHEGTQTTLWAEGVREEHGQDLNLARYIKDGTVATTRDEE